MALHGNKSQSARTQALAGFKSGDIRALVATDIAARGIDIDDLPHVVNYEIPNVPEDYVHRIGRTGRAGNDGAAVSLVCLDEEGFMQEIERFTKQQIPAQVIEGFGARARRARRADRHGPPDHLGRRGQAAQPRGDEGRGQGRAPGDDAAHPRQQGREAPTRRLAQRRRAQRLPAMARATDGAQRRARSRKASARIGGPAGPQRPRRRHGRQRQWRSRRGRTATAAGAAPRRWRTQPRDGAHNIASPFVQRDAPPREHRRPTRPVAHQRRQHGRARAARQRRRPAEPHWWRGLRASWGGKSCKDFWPMTRLRRSTRWAAASCNCGTPS